jgi:hypothetical protein
LHLPLWFGAMVLPLGAAAPSEPEGFPNLLPKDIDFATVTQTEGYPKLRYPVPIIGWKHYPEEIHVTPAGALVLPEPRRPFSLCLQPALALEGESVPAVLDPDAVRQQLVDGYKPGVLSEWGRGGVKVRQLAFGSLLEGEEVRTGRETLVGLSRFSLRNESDRIVKGILYFCLGEGARHQSIKQFHPVYPGALRWVGRSVLEQNGDVAVSVLENSLGRVAFTPMLAAGGQGTALVLNAGGNTITQPELVIDIERAGDQVMVGGRIWPAGIDLYLEASTRHVSPVSAQIESSTGGQGWLGASGYGSIPPKTGEYVAPGKVSGPLLWRDLKSLLPNSRSKLSLRPFIPGAAEPVKAQAWEPIVHLVTAGTLPKIQPRMLEPEKNSLRITFELKPGQERAVDIAVPYFPVAQDQAEGLARLRFNDRLSAFRRFWERELNRNAEFIVPEKAIRDSYRACLAYNLLLVDRDPASGLLLPHPDATDYEKIWGGDSGVIMQSMDRLGYFAETADYTRIFLARQGMRRPDGEIQSEAGFLHGDARERWLNENGFLLWAMAEHYQLSGDLAWLRAVASRMVAAADWIIHEREHNKALVDGKKPRHYGLLPRGRSTDLADWDNWYFNDTYSYLGLTSAARVLTNTVFAADAERFRREADDYRQCILASLDASINTNSVPPFVPLTPYKNELPTREYLYRFWYSIVSPIYLVEAGVFNANDHRATWINEQIESKVMVSGLPRFSPDEIDPHYVYNQALTQLLRGETDKFVWSLYSLFAYGQSRDTYATVEVVNFRTGDLGDHWDACRQPHMHSNSRVLAMLRIALLLEEGNSIHLMRGAPRAWLADGKRVEVRKAPTDFGEVGFTVHSQVGSGEITYRLSPPRSGRAKLVLHVRPPSRYGSLRSVVVDGKEFTNFGPEVVNLGALEKATTVKCTFK